MNLKQQVEAILRGRPETRNSDITLMIEIWRQYYGVGDGISVNQLYDLPRHDGIKRIRAAFNAQGVFWPTDLKIALGRGIQENDWRVKLGYPKVEETKNPTKDESYTSKVLEQKLL